jgi:hypothetical protein
MNIRTVVIPPCGSTPSLKKSVMVLAREQFFDVTGEALLGPSHPGRNSHLRQPLIELDRECTPVENGIGFSGQRVPSLSNAAIRDGGST